MIIFKTIMLFLLFMSPFFLHSSTILKDDSFRIHKILLSIPPSDLKNLENFFIHLFSQSEFAYTLLGEKPAVCIDYNLDVLLQVLPEGRMDSLALIYRGGKSGKNINIFFK